MSIKLRFTAQLKDKAGMSNDTIPFIKNESLQDLIRRIAEKYGIEFKSILFDEKGVYRHSNLIVINQEQVTYQENVTLAEGVEVTLMSPISGG